MNMMQIMLDAEVNRERQRNMRDEAAKQRRNRKQKSRK